MNVSLNDNISKNIENNPDKIINNLDDIINVTQATLNSIIDKKSYHAMKLCDVNFIACDKYEATITVCNQLTEYIDKIYKKIWINQDNTIDKHNFEPKLFVSDSNEPPLEEVNSLLNQVLKSVEKLYKRHSDVQITSEDDKLLKSLIVQPLCSDLDDCDLTSINEQLKNVLKLSIGSKVLRSCLPLLEQHALLVQFFITQQTMAYRVLSKMNYLLSTLFTDLTSNVSKLLSYFQLLFSFSFFILPLTKLLLTF